jgi:beta-lactamase superfamily II metal-dependent hydrolase
MGKYTRPLFLAAALVAGLVASGIAAKTLDIYFIDVEGGQATLIVTPAGESLLIDTGFPGSGGTFQSLPGDPKNARDPQRIVAAAKDAGIARIDNLLVTHFHADHVGGVVELSQLLPIRTFIDYGSVLPASENVAGTLAAFDRYAAVRANGRHIEAKPGARLPLKGVEAIVLSAGGSTIAKPLAGAGGRNAGCASPAPETGEKIENPRSTGIRLRYGRFRFLDLGDLVGPPLRALVCPDDRVGPVQVYLVTHHGGPDAADPATLAAFTPRVAVLNNGAVKGGAAATLASLHSAPGVDVWQLHKTTNAGAENVADDRIANLDDRTAHWIKLSANGDGSFRVTNGRTGAGTSYRPR